ncbi:uncharacterized protein C14orf132 homolog isoform X2 [Chelonia mydas]|uniref:uncharacterized protein C14orf132 homolog isoform X2 n=1 Tax=Chelonia mydas TaxID=8469 RepID=UPI001CA82588|nr:uncharacterized protein C14orf132 homolog isoform X2 [Chelonia mydas]
MTARAGSAAAVLGAAAARAAARADHERRLRGAGLLSGRRDRTELELLTRPRLLLGEDQLPPPPPPPPPQRHRDLPTPGSSGSLSSSSTATTRSSTMDLSFMAAQSPTAVPGLGRWAGSTSAPPSLALQAADSCYGRSLHGLTQ